jgi:8-oxo-dGTP diphosphatase
MMLQVGVKLVIRNKAGDILLVQRSDKDAAKKSIRPKWEIPGGRINREETLLEGLKREVLEEIGVEITGKIQLLAAQDIFAKDGRHVVRLTYGATVDDIYVKLSAEHQAWRWSSVAAAKQLELDSYLAKIIADGLIDN